MMTSINVVVMVVNDISNGGARALVEATKLGLVYLSIFLG